MRQILSAGCITWGEQLPSGTEVPLSDPITGPPTLWVQGSPKLTGTLMASTGKHSASQASAMPFWKRLPTYLEKFLRFQDSNSRQLHWKRKDYLSPGATTTHV